MKFGAFRKSQAAAPDVPWDSGNQRSPRGEDNEVAALSNRLDELTAQLDRLGRLHAATAATAHANLPDRTDEPADQRLAQAIARLDQRLNHMIAEGQSSARDTGRSPTPSDRIDQAVAEIAARQRALDTTPAAPSPAIRQPEPLPRAPGPAQDITGLEQQLRAITTQMQAIHRPCAIDDAVTALRADLAAIGRTLAEAMPRRAVEALEIEVRSLKERIDERRHSGADASAIAGVEQGLAEVRDALRSLTPAEGLAGFDEAIQGLSRKIDQIVATSQDPRALQQMETAIAGLRTVVSRVASDDALAKLSEEVRGLATKIDHIADTGMREGADALSNLEQRIATLADALEAGVRSGQAVPAKLEALIKSLSDKIDQLQLSRGDHLALGSLEDRIVKLVEKLDANDSRLGHLGAIERGLADLVIKLDELRSGNGSAKFLRDSDPPATGLANDIKRDIAEIKEVQSASEQRTKDTLHAVHGTLGQVFDRLAVIETDIRKEPVLRPEGGPPAPQAPMLAAAATVAPATDAGKPMRLPPQMGQMADPTLPPDYPLEPGSGTPRGRTPGSPADRIAASEAALGPAKPSQPETGNSNFIIAARRAAQAAGEAPPPRPMRAAITQAGVVASGRGRITKGRLRSAAVAISVVVIVLGTLRVAMNFLSVDHLGTAAQAPKQPQPPVAKSEPLTPPASPAPAAPGRRSEVASPDDVITSLTPASGLVIPSEPRRSVAPAQPAPVAAKIAEKSLEPEPTGSLGRPGATPAAAAPNPPPPVAPRPAGDKVPVAINSPALRAALAQADPTAEYELALRYAEGRGVPQNLEEAARWFERAAKSGLAPAQFRLGSLYEKGHGVKKDIETARQLYVAAAEKGNAKAMHNLAVLHAEGVDGKPDYKSAGHWFGKAAAYGIADSQFNIGILYARGIGVEQNLPESFKWFALAATQGDQDAAKKRDDVAARLDPQSLVAAKLAVQTWVAEPQPEGAVTVKVPAGGWDKAPVAQPTKSKPRPAASKADPS